MSITLTLELGYEFAVNATIKEVFDVLSDVPTSASFYPQVKELVDLGDNAYRWDMEPVGLEHINLQIVYASAYTSNRKKATVNWVPVPDMGNAQVAGSWQISSQNKATHLVLTVEASITLPLPSLMKMVVQPVVEAEFERLTETYIANLCEHFGGEVEFD